MVLSNTGERERENKYHIPAAYICILISYNTYIQQHSSVYGYNRSTSTTAVYRPRIVSYRSAGGTMNFVDVPSEGAGHAGPVRFDDDDTAMIYLQQ